MWKHAVIPSYIIILDSVKFDEDIIHYHRAAANGGCLTQLTTIITQIGDGGDGSTYNILPIHS